MVNYNLLFIYDPNIPSKLRHKVDRKRVKAGSEVKPCMHSKGYHVVSVFGKTEYVHHIVWKMHGKEIPDGMEIDHKDLDRGNNKIENLRLATGSQNMGNINTHKDKEGDLPKGVYREGKKFVGRICHQGKKVRFASYDLEEVMEWISKERKRLFMEFSR